MNDNNKTTSEGNIQELSPEMADKLKKYRQRKKRKKVLIPVAGVLAFLIASYLIFVFANIPFIRKWRDIYIETAMSTFTHQWLATAFIPGYIIDDVMESVRQAKEAQKDYESEWSEPEVPDPSTITDSAIEVKDPLGEFFSKWDEINSASVRKYLSANGIDTAEELETLKIADLSGSLELTTTKGDSLLVCDVKNSLMIIGIKGNNYVGKMAIVKDPSLVCMGKSRNLGSMGEIIDKFGANYNAVLAVNASGFKDKGGHGSGGAVLGSLVIDGVDYGGSGVSYHKFFGMKYDNKFYIANPWVVDKSEYRWGMEFFPALVVDGECVVAGTYGLGIQPRTTVGQTQDGDFIILVVDGRQVGYSLGCTMEECANQMIKYGVYQAANFDGGSSSIMWYDGAQITKSSSPSGFGRYLPDALYIKRVS